MTEFLCFMTFHEPSTPCKAVSHLFSSVGTHTNPGLSLEEMNRGAQYSAVDKYGK